MKKNIRSFCALVLAGALWISLGGCATVPEARGGQRLDPWENFNRKVFAFNEGFDRNLLKPVATVYANVVPQTIRRGIDNFFANAADAWSAVNNVLQGKGQAAFEDVVRVGTNTVFGLLGFIDVAGEIGIPHRYEDFGQTLGRWGIGTGPYLVLPLFGPSTIRDTVAFPLDRAASPAYVINDGAVRLELSLVQIINARANLLRASQVIDDIALDKYTFVRDAYLQRRRSLVFDGDAPDATGGAAEAPASAAPTPGPASSAPAPAPLPVTVPLPPAGASAPRR